MSTLSHNAPIAYRMTIPKLSPEATGLALGVTAALIWGSYLAMARAGISSGLGAPDIAFIRSGVAGLIMLPWLLRHDPLRLAGIGWRRALVLAALAGPLFVLIGAGGYRFAPLAHGAVLQPAALTIGAMIAATILFGERLTAARIVGIATILSGLVFIAGPGLLHATASTPIGDAMFVAAGLMWAAFSILSKRWGVSPVAATAAVSVLAALIYVPVYLAVTGIEHLAAIPVKILVPQVIVQGVLSGVVAVMAYARAVQLLGPGRAAVFPALVPAVAILLGVPIVGEVPTWFQTTGLALVTSGLLIAIGIVRLPSWRS
jgi:drug/metabolite transporter (DMT)-like permease